MDLRTSIERALLPAATCLVLAGCGLSTCPKGSLATDEGCVPLDHPCEADAGAAGCTDESQGLASTDEDSRGDGKAGFAGDQQSSSSESSDPGDSKDSAAARADDDAGRAEHAATAPSERTVRGITGGDFEDEDAWNLRGVAIADGRAVFASGGTNQECRPGLIWQTVAMPERDAGAGHVLELEVATDCDDGGCAGIQVEIDDSVARLPLPRGGTHRLCLGRAADAPEVRLALRPSLHEQPSCGEARWPTLEAVDLASARAGECPADDEQLDHDFASSQAWQLEHGAAIEEGVLASGAAGDASISVAVAGPATALHVTFAAASYPGVGLSLGGMYWNHFPIVSSLTERTTFHACLPDWAHGTVQRLTVRGYQARIERVWVDDEPSCADGSFDSGFTRSLGSGSWSLLPSAGAMPTVTDDGLRIETASRTTLTALARVPETTEARRPGFVASARLDGTSDATLSVYDGSGDFQWQQRLGGASSRGGATTLADAFAGQLMVFATSITASDDEPGGGAVVVDELGPSLVSN